MVYEPPLVGSTNVPLGNIDCGKGSIELKVQLIFAACL